ncbi:hypothetical protein OSB04_016118 [Centaurea solstitialis]|uniref:Uncharacterized protein n=1 Tax=Centaurea solstitialis TaxID=347529 RepID=A0AA38T0E8_9ASTR|nr:hypothetical protein OSB04_016118 [Centaurea solstitialis]
MGFLSFFLGIEIITTSTSLFMSRHHSIRDILERCGMSRAKFASTPLTSKLPAQLASLEPIICSRHAYSDANWAGNFDVKTSTSTHDQIADALTKSLSSCRHVDLRHKMHVLNGDMLLRGRNK